MSVNSLIGKGIFHLYSNQNNEALSCFDKVIELDHNNLEAYNNKGIVLNRLKKYDEAIKCFDMVIYLNPNFSLINASNKLQSPTTSYISVVTIVSRQCLPLKRYKISSTEFSNSIINYLRYSGLSKSFY